MTHDKRIGICAGIVTYNPEISRLVENYKHISAQVDCVIICDNGSKNIEDIKYTIKDSKLHIIAMEKNKGIAYALNQICQYGLNMNYDWILTLDQDSVCSEKMVDSLSKYCGNEIAIIGPKIVYRENERYIAKYKNRIENVDWVITSGSLTNLRIWKEIGGFDNALFIDKVDTDYGVRANQAGYKVIRDNEVVLDHELGKLKCRRLFGRTIYVTNHNETRIYYQCRNNVYVFKKIKYGHPIVENLKIAIKVILYEDNKLEKLKKVYIGLIDGMKLSYKVLNNEKKQRLKRK